MLVTHVALVSETSRASFGEVAKIGAALQKQVVRDFGPIWDIKATVDAFETLEDVPIGYWPIIVQDDIGFDGAAGIHLDKDGQPFALVQFSADWALTASHEVVEMLADPFGDRLVAGQSPKSSQGRVWFLVEVADPSEAAPFGYSVNGILVSDFYTPNYFDPVTAAGVRYSFTGAIKKPRQVLKGGYLSWQDPSSGDWWQETWFTNNKSKFVNLGPLTAANGSIRSQIDAINNPKTYQFLEKKRGKKRLTLAAASKAAVKDNNPNTKSTSARAKSLHTQIAALKKKKN